MSGPDPLSPPDEFGQIAEFFRPLTRGDPGAFDLLDDAAVVTARTGTDLVMTQDAIVEGVHFPAGEAPEDVAARFFRVNLSDLAAKGAEPFAWLQTLAWSPEWPLERRRAFAGGLAREAGIFGLTLLGGDTVSTPGPFMASGTFLGRCPPGGVIRRSGARPGDLLLVTGPIGDGWLGLQAVTGALKDPTGGLARKFRRPEPRLDLRAVLRACARAAADVSDGLIADARHLATASGCGVHLALEQSPLSEWGKDWLAGSPDEVGARITLASGGDDYEIVLAAEPAHREVLEAAGCSVVGVFVDGPSEVLLNGRALDVGPGGWRHA
ncbi:MAG: thiamine-phosphate kinase [Phenylobacterium sp.]|nr:thiamine-phosphate kinase [Phenylobacterium sp.]